MADRDEASMTPAEAMAGTFLRASRGDAHAALVVASAAVADLVRQVVEAERRVSPGYARLAPLVVSARGGP